MPTPKWTAEGVKIIPQGDFQYNCGKCKTPIHFGYGCPSRGVDCPNCGTHNRTDFAPDLASEKLESMMYALYKTDSVIANKVADEIFLLIPSVVSLEKTDRIMFGGDEPLRSNGHEYS